MANGKTLLKVWEPCGKAIINEIATHYIYPQRYQQQNIDQPMYIAENNIVLGVIKLSEPEPVRAKDLDEEAEKYYIDPEFIRSKWPHTRKFWLYPVSVLEAFEDEKKLVEKQVNSKSPWVKKPVIMEKVEVEEEPESVVEKSESSEEEEVLKAEWNIDFKEGDKGTAILQTHEMGLTEDQTKMIPSFGWEPVKLNTGQINRIKKLSGESGVEEAYQKAQQGDSSKLASIVGKIKTEDLSELDKKLVALVSPVNVHTDFRMQPSGKNYWEGGEVFTPGNQFKENKIKGIKPEDRLLMDFKAPATTKGVIKGPIEWMKVGEGKPQVFPPGAPGSAEKSWSRFFIRDHIKWEAGIQDEHYKEFKFDGNTLKGRFVMQYMPSKFGGRKWVLLKPEKQEYDSEVFKQNDQVSWEAVIVKKEKAKRLVTAIVLKPETTDAQGTVISSDVIEDAAHKFMMKMVRGEAKGIGYMHKEFGRDLQLVESWITPEQMMIAGQPVSKGSWVMRVKVFDDRVWKEVLGGNIRGFSIGGRAAVTKV